MIHQLLKEYWGYELFRPLQQEAIESVLAGKDSVVVLPTGGGKSLCYQIPALCLDGTALIVSPLISLMNDQVQALQSNGISAGCLHSGQDYSDRLAVNRNLRNGKLKLLYISPERLATEQFLQSANQFRISFIAIDEAHCISMWGHDFRPEYRQISQVRKMFPHLAVHSYTATATSQVRDDICKQLSLRDPKVLVGCFDRPNLILKGERRDDLLKQVSSVIKRHQGESGIVYCIRRKDTEDLAAKLNKKGIRALAYHAGMEDTVRHRNQEQFMKEQVDVIVATVAFGMGIDKSNVRFVIHAGMPKSVEHYQQESGRAGRDGLDAECILLYGGQDLVTWKFFLSEMDPQSRSVAQKKLDEIYRYCNSATCRRQYLLNYFGQNGHDGNCGGCDICLGDTEIVENSLVVAQKILSCVFRLKEGFGPVYTTRVLLGSRDERILNNQHEKLSTYGLLKGYKRSTVRDWIEQLIAQGCMGLEGEYQTLNVTEKGWEVLKGDHEPRLLKPPEKELRKAQISSDLWHDVDHKLFEKLRELRREIAQEKNRPAYMIFGDDTLRDMARVKPKTADELLGCKGVGQVKSRNFGEQFLQVINKHR